MRKSGPVTVLVLTVGLLTACDRGPSSAQQSGVTSATGSTASVSGGTAGGTATVAPGWSAEQQGDLRFAVPEGFQRQAAGVGMAGASAQYVGSTSQNVPVAPAVAVFVETGNVGPVQVRASLLADARSAQLGASPAAAPRAITVPGSQGAELVEWRWDYQAVAGRPAVPSRQVEVVIATGGKEQYGLLIGGPTTYLTDDVVTKFLAGLAVTGNGA